MSGDRGPILSKRGRPWLPSSMEATCLQHLDREGSWEWMRSPEPDQSERIGWWHVRRIFVFNLALFAVVLFAILAIIAFGSGYTASDFKEDLPLGLGLTAIVASAMALYVTKLYRQSWNRRARSLGS